MQSSPSGLLQLAACAFDIRHFGAAACIQNCLRLHPIFDNKLKPDKGDAAFNTLRRVPLFSSRTSARLQFPQTLKHVSILRVPLPSSFASWPQAAAMSRPWCRRSKTLAGVLSQAKIGLPPKLGMLMPDMKGGPDVAVRQDLQEVVHCFRGRLLVIVGIACRTD